MNVFDLIQTGDWHIGRPFRRFEPSMAAALARTRRDIVGRCAGIARSVGARHVLVAGDVFDTPDVRRETWAPARQLMADTSDIAWHIIAGNHDYDRSFGVWDAFTDGAPANVHVHRTRAPVELAPGVWLLPAPMFARAQSDDPTAAFTDTPTPFGAIRIGLAHGSVEGTAGQDMAVPIAADAAQRARLDHLALGDWHGRHAPADRTWYAGTPEPMTFEARNAQGDVLHVRIAWDEAAVTSGAARAANQPEPTSRVSVRPHAVGQHTWHRIDVGADVDAAVDEITQWSLGLKDRAGSALLLVRATGTVSSDDYLTLCDAVDAARARIMHVTFDDRVSIRAPLQTNGATHMLAEPALNAIAQRLLARAASAPHRDSDSHSDGGAANESDDEPVDQGGVMRLTPVPEHVAAAEALRVLLSAAADVGGAPAQANVEPSALRPSVSEDA